MSLFCTYLGSVVTVWNDFGTTEKKDIYYALFRFLFLFFLQTVVQITIFFHLDVKILIINTNTINTLLYYIKKSVLFSFPVIINKTLSVSSWFCWYKERV